MPGYGGLASLRERTDSPRGERGGFPPWGAACIRDETVDVVSHESDPELMALIRAIIDHDMDRVERLLAQSRSLASARVGVGASRASAAANYLKEIERYLYAGDTALHVAAAAYRKAFATQLVVCGADVRARNRRGAEPLHAAAGGMPGSATWNPRAQAATIAWLIAAGADPNAPDQDGATPLHKAVRTRCADAVKALLDGGADTSRKNKGGSTALRLAEVDSGRGGSGSPEARAQQREILRLLDAQGANR